MSKEYMIPRKKEVPLDDDSSNVFLQVMICIAVFLFSVTLAGVLSVNSMLKAWNESILGALTVQIMPVNDTNRDKAAAETLQQQRVAVEFLRSRPEIDSATPLSDKQLNSLLQPWLGDGVEVSDLPVPRLIDVKLIPGVTVDFADLSEKLAQAAPLASIDNHKLWLEKLIKFADSLKLLALVVLILVVVVTSGAIFYCTQTSLGLHRYVIEILHLMGAKDTYVAQQYAKRTAFLGFVGGVYGLGLAIPAIFVIAGLAAQIEGGIISEAKLELNDWLMIFSLPFGAAFMAMVTAYYTVKKTLRKFM